MDVDIEEHEPVGELSRPVRSDRRGLLTGGYRMAHFGHWARLYHGDHATEMAAADGLKILPSLETVGPVPLGATIISPRDAIYPSTVGKLDRRRS